MTRLFTGYSGRQLTLHATGLVATLSGVLVVAPLLPEIIDSFGITSVEAGVSLSVMWGANALAQYPGGRYSDHLPSKVVLVLSQLTLLAGFATLTISTAFPTFVLGLALVGVGYGLFEPAGFVMLRNLFHERRGWAFGVRDSAVNLGSALSAALGIAILGLTQWRAAFVPSVLVLGLVTVGTHRVNDDTYALSRVELGLRRSVSRLVTTPQLLVTLLITSLFLFVWQGTASFLPTYLRVEKGLSALYASVAYAAVYVIGMLSTPLAGGLGDRWTHLRVAAAASGLSLLGLGTLVVSDSTALLVSGLFVFSVGLTTFWPVIYVHLMNLLSSETVGGDLGAFRTIYFAVGSLGPAYIGFVADWFDYTTAFASLLVCFALSGVLLLWLSEVR